MYAMSFTAGGLLYREFELIVALYFDCNDWDCVEEMVLRDNLFQLRTVSSLKRVLREVLKRVNCLSDRELRFFIDGSNSEKLNMLWLAVCRQYKFIGEFAVKVLREKYCNLVKTLEYKDFDVFFDDKSEWVEELGKIKPSTRSKLRQVLFRMMREAGLISSENEIVGVVLGSGFLELLREGDLSELSFFPISNCEYDRLVGHI